MRASSVFPLSPNRAVRGIQERYQRLLQRVFVLLRGTAIVSILTLLSRILGFGRDLLVARLLGASIFADAFFVAFRIPNLLRSLVAEGALTSAFTPVFSSALARGKDTANQTLRRVTGFLVTLTVTISALLIWFAPEVVVLFAPGFTQDQSKLDLCVTLTRIMAPYIACISLIAMLNAALNTLQIFGTSAWAQVTMNIVLIVGALVAMPFDLATATIILAISFLLGGIIQIIAQVPACRRGELSLRPSFRIFGPDVRGVIRLMVPAAVGASVYQVTIFIATLLASLLPTGSVSWLFYADRVAQFPVGIFSIALASVLLPALSNASATADHERFHRSLGDSLRYTNFFMIPMAAGIWALALPITQMLFERGAFTSESSLRTSQALQALSVGLWASSCHSMLVRAFIARKDTITPTLIALCTLVVNVCASLLLMGPLSPIDHSSALVGYARNLQTSLSFLIPYNASMGHVGLALASSIAAYSSLALVVLFFAIKIRHFPWRSFSSSTARSMIAAAVMVAVIRTTTSWCSGPLTQCAIGILAGGLTFVVVSLLVRSREAREALTVMRATLARARAGRG